MRGRWTEGSYCYGVHTPNSTGTKVSLGRHLWAVVLQPQRGRACEAPGPGTWKYCINGGNHYFILFVSDY